MNGLLFGSLGRFLNSPDLPPYYRVKACIVRSAVDEENEIRENFIATK